MGMAVAIPTPTSAVIDELHPQAKPGEDEEIVDINTPEKPAEQPAAQPAAPAAPAAAAPAEDEEAEIPESLRGKSRKEIAKMYSEAQSLIGRQGNELGEFRKKADQVIQASLAALAARQQPQAAPAAPAAPKVPEEVEFFAKPADAVAQMIENHPVILKIKETLGEAAKDREVARATASTEKFNAAHPDAAEIMADPEFQTWVKASRVRSQLLHRAHTTFDFDAGDEVFGTWKALRSVKAPAPAAPTSNPVSEAARTLAAARKKQALQDAAAPTSGNPSPAKSDAKKIYRRADVIKLMTDDPQRYEQLATEIELAYREGRVR